MLHLYCKFKTLKFYLHKIFYAILSLAEELNNKSFFLNEKLLSKFYRGLIDIKLGNVCEGEDIIKEVMAVYSLLGLTTNKNMIRKIGHKILKVV